MADDKPKHKPQPKRTLEEVLRSLKDLVRNNLTRAPPRRPGAPAQRPAAPDEPESFNDALTRLDAMIDEKIVAPPAREPRAAPEPPLADDALEIDWDDLGETPDTGAAPLEYRAGEPDAPPGLDIDFDSHANTRRAGEQGAGDPASDDVASNGLEDSEPQDVETIELEPVSPEDAAPDTPAPGGNQAAFSFAGPDTGEPGSARGNSAEAPDGSPVPDDERDDSYGSAASNDVEPGSLSILEPGTFGETTPAASGIERNAPARAASVPADPHEDMLELSRAEPAMTPNDSLEPPSPDQPGTGTDPASHGEGGDGMSRKSEATAAPLTERPPGAQDPPAMEPPTLEEEIPVLEEVAPLDPPAPPKLPEATRAREIAIRAIARLNIERRKDGEAPLDIKTIERLQQYLAEALASREAGKPK